MTLNDFVQHMYAALLRCVMLIID